jgi:hypothetical protein
MVLVRAAKEQDASAIAHVHVQSWLTTYSGIVPDDYLASLNEAERVLLVARLAYQPSFPQSHTTRMWTQTLTELDASDMPLSDTRVGKLGS